MPAEKRLVCITAAPAFGAVSRPRRHSRLYVSGLRDFFPPEAFGAAKRKNGDSMLVWGDENGYRTIG